MYHSLDNRLWFTMIFLPLKESLTLIQIYIFFTIPTLVFYLQLLRIEIPKLIPSSLMEIYDRCICLS